MEEFSGKPDKGELEIINKFTRRNFSENEIYCFSVVLCDNEIDRDFERFSDNSLSKLEKLFVGVTGVLDHNPKTDNQTARIFSCKTEIVSGKLTSDGKPYKRLFARAYMPRTEKNSDFINELESGIKKEVSIGCSVKKRLCSICGNNAGSCSHVKGKKYNDKICYLTLDEPNDAYEWSFVAVPAQKAAGVIKNYNFKKGGDDMNIEKKLFGNCEQTFSADEMNILAEKFRTLSEKAADGETYRHKLETDIKKFAAMAFSELDGETLSFITEKMNAAQLENFCNALQKKASVSLPIKPQLCGENKINKNNNKDNNTFYKNI